MPTLEVLARLTRCEVVGDLNFSVQSIAPLEFAASDQISFLVNERYLDAAHTSQAGALITTQSLALELSSSKPCLIHPSPMAAAARIAAYFYPPQRRTGIHHTASIHESARIAADVYVAPYAVIEAGAVLESGVQIAAHAYVGEEVTIGDSTIVHPGAKILAGCVVGARCVLHAGVVIGSDGFGFASDALAQQGQRHVKMLHLGNVVIGDDVEIGANATIDRATFGSTTIGNGCKIDNLVMIAHNVQLAEDVLVAAQAGIAGSARLGHDVMVGGQAGIVGHIQVGDRARIAAQSGVARSLSADEAVAGSPHLPVGEWRRQFALLKQLPKLLRRLRHLSEVADEGPHS